MRDTRSVSESHLKIFQGVLIGQYVMLVASGVIVLGLMLGIGDISSGLRFAVIRCFKRNGSGICGPGSARKYNNEK